MTRLNEDELTAALEGVPEWSEVNAQISRTFQFDTFTESMRFVERIAEYSERVQHHPEILIRYNKVTLTVSTHDAGGITEKDFELARESDGYVLV